MPQDAALLIVLGLLFIQVGSALITRPDEEFPELSFVITLPTIIGGCVALYFGLLMLGG